MTYAYSKSRRSSIHLQLVPIGASDLLKKAMPGIRHRVQLLFRLHAMQTMRACSCFFMILGTYMISGRLHISSTLNNSGAHPFSLVL